MSEFNIVTPNMSDIPDIMHFLQEYIDSGIILFRDKNEISQTILNYCIIKNNNIIIACSFLQIHNTDLCEVRSLLVDKKYRKKGLAKKIILFLIKKTKKMSLKKIMVLTYIKEVFLSIGFIETDKKELPYEKIWNDCLRCKFYTKCEEILLIKNL
jgi:amino-acid N-acetyltransferase